MTDTPHFPDTGTAAKPTGPYYWICDGCTGTPSSRRKCLAVPVCKLGKDISER